MIRGIVKSVIEGVIKLFAATGRPGETLHNREYFQHYGFTSRPLAGAEIIILREGNHIIAVASDDRRFRLAVADGEVALYTDEGDKIHLKRNKIIEVVSGGKLIANVANEVDVTTKTAKVTASVSCTIISPAVTLNASASCIVNSPSVVLGAQGTPRAIADERIVAALNAHTHAGGPPPDAQMLADGVCTSVTKAS